MMQDCLGETLAIYRWAMAYRKIGHVNSSQPIGRTDVYSGLDIAAAKWSNLKASTDRGRPTASPTPKRALLLGMAETWLFEGRRAIAGLKAASDG